MLPPRVTRIALPPIFYREADSGGPPASCSVIHRGSVLGVVRLPVGPVRLSRSSRADTSRTSGLRCSCAASCRPEAACAAGLAAIRLAAPRFRVPPDIGDRRVRRDAHESARSTAARAAGKSLVKRLLGAAPELDLKRSGSRPSISRPIAWASCSRTASTLRPPWCARAEDSAAVRAEGPTAGPSSLLGRGRVSSYAVSSAWRWRLR